MRTLHFIVEGQSISPDPSCSFDGLFPGRNTEVRAHFTFSPEWKYGVKVAAFHSMLGKEFPPSIIDEDGCCMIPVEALELPTFKLSILGKTRGTMMTTNTLTIYQKGGTA